MNVYSLRHENIFKRSIPPEEQDCFLEMFMVDDEDTKRMKELRIKNNWFTGQPFADKWIPITLVVDEDTKIFPVGDNPFTHGLYTPPVFSIRAVEALQDLLEGNGELLPLRCESGSYFVFNVTQVVDALDEEKSDFKALQEIDPSIFWDAEPYEMGIVKHEFIPEKVANLSIFRISFTPTYKANYVFITDRFVEQIHEEGLKGFDYQLIWSSS